MKERKKERERERKERERIPIPEIPSSYSSSTTPSEIHQNAREEERKKEMKRRKEMKSKKERKKERNLLQNGFPSIFIYVLYL